MYKIITYVKEDEKRIADYKSKSIFLWNNHVLYTRNAIISIPNSLPDTDSIITRLLVVEDELGELIRPYYSDTDVNKLVTLLKEHIRIAGKIALNDVNDPTDYILLMENNGIAIVDLMSSMNPYYWPKTTTWPLWQAHMNHVIDQITYRRNSDWTNDILSVDSNNQVIENFANLYAKGTIYQNLEKFSEPVTK